MGSSFVMNVPFCWGVSIVGGGSVGAGGTWAMSASSPQFCWEPESTLKEIKSNFKQTNKPKQYAGHEKRDLIGPLVQKAKNVKIMPVRQLTLDCCSNHDGSVPISHTTRPFNSWTSAHNFRIKWIDCSREPTGLKKAAWSEQGPHSVITIVITTPNSTLLGPCHSLSLCRCLAH